MAFCSEEDACTKRIRQRLALSIVLLSQGVPFLHAGQEFCRTKNGDSNSYRSGDGINRLDWEKRAELCEEIEYVRQLIRLRRSHPAFRLQKEEEVKEHLSFMSGTGEVTAYKLKNIAAFDPWNEIIVVHCPSAKRKRLSCPPRNSTCCTAILLRSSMGRFKRKKASAERHRNLCSIRTKRDF